MSHVLLYVTVATVADGLAIGRALVEDRLAACANVLPGVTSVFRWEGKVETAAEAVLVMKTRAGLAEAATARVRALHGYSCPCVVALPIVGGNPDFLAWIDASTDQPRGEDA